jgi:hypothetical protein
MLHQCLLTTSFIRLVSILSLHLGDREFVSIHSSLSPSRKALGWNLQWCHYSFFWHSFKFISHSHPTTRTHTSSIIREESRNKKEPVKRMIMQFIFGEQKSWIVFVYERRTPLFQGGALYSPTENNRCFFIYASKWSIILLKKLIVTLLFKRFH